MPTHTSKAGRKSSLRALCVGINDYPYQDNDLNGCVNDATAWASVLRKHFGFRDIQLLLDKQATKKRTVEALKTLLTGARSGDVLVFTNSSHGSYVAETDGDEPTYDEILCPYDIDANDIRDDELRGLIAGLKDGVRLTVILDNCFSGTATRALPAGPRTPDDRRTRFLSPALRGLPVLANPWTAKARNRFPQSRMKEVLLSGCTDREYSYDAKIGGVYHGAMTYYALKALTEAQYKVTYAQLHKRLRSLITDYPQHPQLEGKAGNKKRQVFQ
jgi:metacaspase-1